MQSTGAVGFTGFGIDFTVGLAFRADVLPQSETLIGVFATGDGDVRWSAAIIGSDLHVFLRGHTTAVSDIVIASGLVAGSTHVLIFGYDLSVGTVTFSFDGTIAGAVGINAPSGEAATLWGGGFGGGAQLTGVLAACTMWSRLLTLSEFAEFYNGGSPPRL